uniref:C2H2-type domain-containing protein n=1 Tax=Psilocybe cubensis TaxID=181762 RepID=A0A8H7Y797_PSICU
MPMGHSSGVQPMPPVYDEPQPMQADYASNYYTTSAQYASNSAPTNQHGYTLPPNGQMNYVQAQGHRSSHHIPRSPSTMPHTPYTHSPSHSYSYPHPSSSYSGNPLERPRSNSQVYPRALSPVNGYDQSPQPQYTEIPIPQTIGISSDYPTSSVRPFPCDLCALSFNRQHDLKRHRETHNGEKPYLCNGGCGKTFTRKDALKRHQVRPNLDALPPTHFTDKFIQLVKKCGKVDESYS